MMVLSVSNCPLQLRGDLTKWLMEINTGIYVGKISARVRTELWNRVTNNIKGGQAVLVYSANNEQGYNILLHNPERQIVDYEGLILARKPKSGSKITDMK